MPSCLLASTSPHTENAFRDRAAVCGLAGVSVAVSRGEERYTAGRRAVLKRDVDPGRRYPA